MFLGGWIAMAWAEAPRIEGTVGVDASVNDPFVRRRGPVGSVAARWGDTAGTVILGSWYPNLGDADYTGITRLLVERNGVSPDISRVLWRAVALQDFDVFHGDPGAAFAGSLHLGIGGGVVGTEDDLVLIQKESDPQARSTASEVHPLVAASVAMDLLKGDCGLRARITDTWYVERVDGVAERKSPVWASVELVVAPGRTAP